MCLPPSPPLDPSHRRFAAWGGIFLAVRRPLSCSSSAQRSASAARPDSRVENSTR